MILIILGLVILCIIAFPGIRDELQWKWASHNDRALDYAGYLKSWPGGRHAGEANTFYDERSWSDAKKINTIQSLKNYQADHPQGKYISQAENGIENLYWQQAKKANTIQVFKTYLQDYPRGEYVSPAIDMIENLRWQDSQKNNTIISYQRYLIAYPSGRYISKTKQKISSLIKDDKPYLAAQKTGTPQAYKTFLVQFPGHKYGKKAQSALIDMKGRDIVDLLNQGKIQANISGEGIESVSVKLRRLVKHNVTVRIPVGTFFICHGAAQNMVGTCEETVVLDNNDSQTISISAACANRTRDIPNSDKRFDVQRSPYDMELQKLMPVLRKAEVNSLVQQAAVWIVTDNASYADLGTLIRRGQFDLYGGTRVINEYEAAMAMKICDKAGINITQKAIWWDRDRIIKGLSDKDLKRWLQK